LFENGCDAGAFAKPLQDILGVLVWQASQKLNKLFMSF
jgi:hypothetical protein